MNTNGKAKRTVSKLLILMASCLNYGDINLGMNSAAVCQVSLVT